MKRQKYSCLEQFFMNAKNDEESFIYRLHEEDYFDKARFETYIANCDQLVIFYSLRGRSDNYYRIIAEILDTFERTLLHLHYHLDPSDICEIENYDVLDQEGYFIEVGQTIRMTTRNLLYLYLD